MEEEWRRRWVGLEEEVGGIGGGVEEEVGRIGGVEEAWSSRTLALAGRPRVMVGRVEELLTV